MVLSFTWQSLLKVVSWIPDKLKVAIRGIVVPLIKWLVIFPDKYTFPPRLLLTQLLPWDPLSDQKNSPMSVFVLTTKKDIDVLPFSIRSVVNNICSYGDPITVVAPASDLESIQFLLNKANLSDGITLLSDEQMLSFFGLSRGLFPSSHSFMQILKFLCVLSSSFDNTIVLDGDTIFLRRRTWVTENKSVLVVPVEYERLHVNFVREKFYWVRHSGLGFTTQAQVMKKIWVSQMVDEAGGLDEFVSLFTQSMREFLSEENTDSFPCEWQLMGDWTLYKKYNHTELASYLNISAVRNETIPSPAESISLEEVESLLHKLSIQYEKYASLSLHAYKS